MIVWIIVLCTTFVHSHNAQSSEQFLQCYRCSRVETVCRFAVVFYVDKAYFCIAISFLVYFLLVVLSKSAIHSSIKMLYILRCDCNKPLFDNYYVDVEDAESVVTSE